MATKKPASRTKKKTARKPPTKREPKAKPKATRKLVTRDDLARHQPLRMALEQAIRDGARKSTLKKTIREFCRSEWSGWTLPEAWDVEYIITESKLAVARSIQQTGIIAQVLPEAMSRLENATDKDLNGLLKTLVELDLKHPRWQAARPDATHDPSQYADAMRGMFDEMNQLVVDEDVA